MPLQLVSLAIDNDTVTALEHLLESAKAGKIIGLAYIALHNGPDYSGDVIGHAKSRPLFTMGVVRALEDLVADHHRKR